MPHNHFSPIYGIDSWNFAKQVKAGRFLKSRVFGGIIILMLPLVTGDGIGAKGVALWGASEIVAWNHGLRIPAWERKTGLPVLILANLQKLVRRDRVQVREKYGMD